MVQAKDLVRVLESLRLLGKAPGRPSDLVWLVGLGEADKLEQTVAKIGSGKVLRTSKGDVTGKIIGVLRIKKSLESLQLSKTVLNGKKKVPPLAKQKVQWTMRALHCLRLINIEEREGQDALVTWLGTGPMLTQIKKVLSGGLGASETNGVAGSDGSSRPNLTSGRNDSFYWEREPPENSKGSLKDLPLDDVKEFLERFDSDQAGRLLESLHRDCREPLVLGSLILPARKSSPLISSST